MAQGSSVMYKCIYRQLQSSSHSDFPRNERETAVPVVRNKEPEVPDVGRVLGQDNVTCELPRGKPEGEVWWLVQLEFSVDPERKEEPSAGILHCRDRREKLSPGSQNYKPKLGKRGGA